MNILLISANREKSPYPVGPIGASYVAKALLADGHSVEILDLCFTDAPDEAINTAIAKTSPGLIGLSIRNVDNLTYPKSTSYLPYIASLAVLLRKTGIPVVVGGSGFSLFPEGLLRRLKLDYGITGEGEAAMRGFAAHLSKGADISGIPNLAYFKGGVFHQNPIRTEEAFSSPARELLDNQRYFLLGGMANVQTKRGCPFTCVYCTYPYLDGNKIRCRKSTDVVDELEAMLDKWKLDYVFFVDDIFNHPAKQAIGICKEIINRGLELDWTCFATPYGMTRELLGLMKEAGCKAIEFGTDAASEVMLKNMGKSFTKEDVMAVSRISSEEGVQAAHYLILGGPGETEETLKEAFDFMDALVPRAVIVMAGVRIYPNTVLEKISIEQGMIRKGESLLDSRFYISPLIGEDKLLTMIERHASERPNWVVPALDIRSSEEGMAFLRRTGYRGPLWDLLGQPSKQGRVG
ncbi:MAG: cobalamin B12-binding domain-containing protein [Deltaproteobacteria bacterium]|nr:cobalamin B12-binding domain-containing protein [Deltaproteobacteria bacterium]